MAENDISSAVASDLGSVMVDYAVAALSTDAADSTNETKHPIKNWEQNLGYYKTIPELRPLLTISNFKIPNKQFVEFHWEDDKTTPIAFSVTNSNPLFITNNIESYAIPELIKEEIDQISAKENKEKQNEILELIDYVSQTIKNK